MEDDMTNSEYKTLTRKHIAERQRRARINSYLEEIQELTSSGNNEVRGQKVKREKAEVLEIALSYLQNNQELVETNNNTIINSDVQDLQTYEEGFKACMTTVLDSFEELDVFNDIASGLQHHLESVLDDTKSQLESNSSSTFPIQESPMALSPSLAKLEQCLQKFENGGPVIGSDAISDISQSETGSGTDMHTYVTTPHNKEVDIHELQNNPELIAGYSVNDWVNMQREYVLQQQMMMHQHQYQQFYNQQYHQQQQHQNQTHHILNVQGKNVQDLSKVNSSNVKQNNSQVGPSKDLVKTDKARNDKDGKIAENKLEANVLNKVWRPW